MSAARRLQSLALVAIALLLLVTFKSSTFDAAAVLDKSAAFNKHKQTPTSGQAKSTGLLEHLENILQKVERAPIESYDEALAKNERTCKGRDVQSNPDQIKGESAFWRQLSSDDLARRRQAVADGIRSYFGLPGLLDAGLDDFSVATYFGTDGRGLVFTGGNKVSARRLSECAGKEDSPDQ